MANVARILDFDTWRPTYAGATVEVLRPGTTTLLSVFLDQALTQPADNPQTLQTMTVGAVNYGKFAQPLYVNAPYQLRINGVDQTGVNTPGLTELIGQNAGYMLSATQRGGYLRRLIDRFDDFVFARDYGALGGESATNTATLTRAIGAVAGQGGGLVILPYGTFPFTTLTLPANVVLQGQHFAATTLQSQEAEAVITLSGDYCGLSDVTLDGVSVQASSIGVYSKANTGTIFDRVLIKRFDTGIKFQGGDRAKWTDLNVSTCAIGAALLGDSDPAGGSDGGAFEFVTWNGGSVTLCTTYGVNLSFEDQITRNVTFKDVAFEGNVAASALRINGARYVRCEDCLWSLNLRNIDVLDDSDTSLATINTVIGLHIEGGYMSGGSNRLDGECQDVQCSFMNLSGITWALSLPLRPITLVDCTEDSGVTITGDAQKLQRWSTRSHGEIAGVTTDGTATVAWDYALNPGEIVYIEAVVTANRRDDPQNAIFHVACGAYQPAAQLDYDSEVENFTVADIITGTNSGATARVVKVSDSGSTGTLYLRDIVGIFENNEQITGASSGDALVNGAITTFDTRLDNVGKVTLRTPHFTHGTLDFDGQSSNFTNGQTVTGGTSGATATLLTHTDAGASGTLTLADIVGAFENNEALTDEGSGDGSVDGTQATIWDVTFAISNEDFQLKVTGAASQTIEWTVKADVKID